MQKLYSRVLVCTHNWSPRYKFDLVPISVIPRCRYIDTYILIFYSELSFIKAEPSCDKISCKIFQSLILPNISQFEVQFSDLSKCGIPTCRLFTDGITKK